MPSPNDSTTQAPEPLGVADSGRYVLRLYVTGMTARSTAAFSAVKAVCDEHLPDRYDLEVIDLYQHPHLARAAQIVAAPTLVKERPAPLRRLIGNLTDTERVLRGLGLPRAAQGQEP